MVRGIGESRSLWQCLGPSIVRPSLIPGAAMLRANFNCLHCSCRYSLVDPRWILPAMYYRVEFPLDGSTPLLFLPTNITAAGALPNYQLQKRQTTLTTRSLRSEGTVKMTNTDAVPCVSITFLDTHRLAHGSGE